MSRTDQQRIEPELHPPIRSVWEMGEVIAQVLLLLMTLVSFHRTHPGMKSGAEKLARSWSTGFQKGLVPCIKGRFESNFAHLRHRTCRRESRDHMGGWGTKPKDVIAEPSQSIATHPHACKSLLFCLLS